MDAACAPDLELCLRVNYSSYVMQWLGFHSNLAPVRAGPAKSKRLKVEDDGELFRITGNSKYPALHTKLTLHPESPQLFYQECVTGLNWALMSSQSSCRSDDHKVRNTVKNKNKKTHTHTSSKQDGKRRKGYRMLTGADQQCHRIQKIKRKRQKPNEARWKKEQTKDLLKAEDARNKIRMAKGGVGHIQRHSCVQIGLISLCYKRFSCFTAQKSLICLYCLSKYTCFERRVYIFQIFLWYKSMNIYNHQPRFIH